MDILSNNSAKRKINKVNDIYSGDEQIEFINRHPIFKTLMKLEFEDVLRRLAKK